MRLIPSFCCALICLFCMTGTYAQEAVDGSFAFDTDPDKKYSLYIPSTYNENEPNQLMVGFHPLNTSRWNAETWRDTLIAFAEMNDLILMCPDGGSDGRVDDQIDTAFTTVLLDSLKLWYAIDEEEIYAMGFSWGGRTTYTYGLSNPDVFKGLMPIGSAVNGTAEIAPVLENAEDMPFYLVHGRNDNLLNRFTLPKGAIENNGACVESIVMDGVDHTIDFPNRNQILTDAFEWLEDVQCGVSTSSKQLTNQEELMFYPNIISKDEQVKFSDYAGSFERIRLFDSQGAELKRYNATQDLNMGLFGTGVYFLVFEKDGLSEVRRIILIE